MVEDLKLYIQGLIHISIWTIVDSLLSLSLLSLA